MTKKVSFVLDGRYLVDVKLIDPQISFFEQKICIISYANDKLEKVEFLTLVLHELKKYFLENSNIHF